MSDREAGGGRNRITARALERVTAAIAAEAFGSRGDRVKVELTDHDGALDVGIETAVGAVSLARAAEEPRAIGRLGGSILGRSQQAEDTVRTFGLTREAFLVITANAFALVGLRRLFFVVRQLLDRLPHLDTGLALVLAFIGVKLVLEALHDNTLAFLNDGEPLRVPQVPTLLSLAVVVGILLVTTGTSLLSDRAFGSDRR